MRPEIMKRVILSVIMACCLAAMSACNATETDGGVGDIQKNTGILFSPSALNFGNVPVDSIKVDTVVVRSSSTSLSAIQVAPQISGSGFSIISGSGTHTLERDGSIRVIVQFKPTSLDSAMGTLSFSHNAATVVVGSDQISLKGKGVSPLPPTTPSLRMPVDGDSGVYTDPTNLTWGKVDLADSYRLEISTSQAFSLIIKAMTGLTDTSAAVSGLALNTRYYWRVRASNTRGQSSYSPPRSFVTGPRPGEIWTLRNSGTDYALSRVTWCSAYSSFIAVGALGAILTSPDGIYWTPQASGTLANLGGVVCSENKVVAVGAAGTVVTSSNMSTWQVNTLGTASLNGVDWSGSNFVAVGDGGLILTSQNATAWTQRTSGTGNFLTSVRWTGSGFVAAGSSVALRSSTGTSWTIPLTGTGTLWDIIYANFRYLISGDGNIWYWNGGEDWERATALDNNNAFYSIAWSGSRYVVVGNRGLIQSSTDGWWTWTSRSSGTANSLRSVTWSGTRFVAVGDNGAIVSSP